MKGILAILLLAIALTCFGQLKHDANWVFGENIGLKFDSAATNKFYPISRHAEANASISDSIGNLKLYLSYDKNSPLNSVIRDYDGNIVNNGDNINVFTNATNAAVFIPVPYKSDSIYFFHIGRFQSSCGNAHCIRLFYSLISKNSQGSYQVIQKNVPMFNQASEESIALIKHADGNGWWLLTHEQRQNTTDSVSNKYLIARIDSTITYYNQVVSGAHKTLYSFAGEIAVLDNEKSQFLDAVTGDNIIYRYSFDRCSGHILLIDSLVPTLQTGTDVYSVAVSYPNVFIASTSYSLASGNAQIGRYKFINNNLVFQNFIYTESLQNFHLGQMEKGPDGNVWCTAIYLGSDSVSTSKYNKHLSIIKFSNTDSAQFVPYYLQLRDSAKTAFGLPNFPNYNLGPEGVFLASAGKDTVLCSNTNSTGVTIGAPPVPNITYLWQPATGLSTTNTAQPTANPTQSTWYYLTATDTTATSCAVNTDSVYVKVETCTGITETQSLQAKLYPNPTTGTLIVELANGHSGHFKLFNLLGQQVFEQPLEHDKTTFKLDLAKGIYLYQITAQGKLVNGKLVLGE